MKRRLKRIGAAVLSFGIIWLMLFGWMMILTAFFLPDENALTLWKLGVVVVILGLTLDLGRMKVVFRDNQLVWRDIIRATAKLLSDRRNV